VVCKEKKEGGLGVRDVRIVNLSLLSKWRWRLLQPGRPLWKEILIARYGNHITHYVDWSNFGTPSSASNWWKNIISIEKAVPGKNWFVDSVTRKVGNGNDTYFWSSKWIGATPLALVFPRLYSLSNQKEKVVSDFIVSQDGRRSWNFLWRRNLFIWEEDLVNNLVNILDSLVLSSEDDCWSWLPDPNKGFSVNSSFKLLSKELDMEELLIGELGRVLKQIWDSAAPSKVIAFSWQLLYDRIPTRSNLEVRGILSSDVPWECVGCVGKVETSSHLFLHCPCVMKIWCEVFKWLGVEIVIPPSLIILYEIVKESSRNTKIRRGMVLIWHTTLWCIWKARNSSIFANGSFNPVEIVENIKVVSWKWSMIRLKLFPCLFYEWTWDPGNCLLH
jgi:hypothetical protein